MEFLPLNRRSEDVLAASFASRGLGELLRLHRAQASQEARRELTQALLDELAEDKPVRDLISDLRDMAHKHSIPEHEVVAIVSTMQSLLSTRIQLYTNIERFILCLSRE